LYLNGFQRLGTFEQLILPKKKKAIIEKGKRTGVTIGLVLSHAATRRSADQVNMLSHLALSPIEQLTCCH
jgi:hypothetical protein